MREGGRAVAAPTECWAGGQAWDEIHTRSCGFPSEPANPGNACGAAQGTLPLSPAARAARRPRSPAAPALAQDVFYWKVACFGSGRDMKAPAGRAVRGHRFLSALAFLSPALPRPRRKDEVPAVPRTVPVPPGTSSAPA